MTGWRPNFTFGALVLGAFPFGAFTFSTFTFITLLPINLALLGANLFSRFASIEPFKGLFNIIFICVFILILGNRGFPFGTMLHSTDLVFLGSVMINPFTSIFRSIFTFGFKFINVFRILFRTVFKSIKIFIPSIGSMILITVISIMLPILGMKILMDLKTVLNNILKTLMNLNPKVKMLLKMEVKGLIITDPRNTRSVE